jgi:hypothetical protein
MNSLLMRDYHEVIGTIVKVELNDDLRLGNALIDRIPYNYVGEQEELFKNQSDYNPLAMNEEDLKNLIPKLNFNLAETNLRFMEKKFIDDKDYWSLYELYQDEYPYNLMDSMTLYSFCRTMIGRPITNEEFIRIRQDMKSIGKSMKTIKNSQTKKKRGVYSIDF